jgi:antibiotic biosynthesis monooxygenase (ABM) superfamily enzyme
MMTIQNSWVNSRLRRVFIQKNRNMHEKHKNSGIPGAKKNFPAQRISFHFIFG